MSDESPPRPVTVSPTTASTEALPSPTFIAINSTEACVLRLKYGPDADVRAWARDDPDTEMVMYMQNATDGNVHTLMESKVLLAKEGALIGLAIERLTYNDFEVKWAALGVAEKKRISLDGIVHRTPEEPGDGEYGLVNLLKAIAAHDPAPTFRIRSIYLFHHRDHPAVEKEYHPFTTNSAHSDIFRILQRFLVQAVIGILEAYVDLLPFSHHAQSDAYISIEEELAGSADVRQYGTARRRVKPATGGCTRSSAARSAPNSIHPGVITATSDDLTPAEFIGYPAPAPGFRVNHGLRLTMDQIRNQLEPEYRVTLVPPADFGAPPTTQEFLEEMTYGMGGARGSLTSRSRLASGRARARWGIW
ncbi:hypothetical protein C8R45DRAFT_1079184 [Mycena sanguinolenta]|nr:hypothetical protein C8R45DRAFT_1079184 [Mycena sanguinolenta]